MYPSQPTLIKQRAVSALLGITPAGLNKRRKRDPLFPKPIKDGTCRQAAVYYVLAEVEAYIAAQLAARKGEARA